MSFFEELYNGNLDISKYTTYISDAFYEIYPFVIMYMAIFTVSLWFIFKKEEITPWFSLIPIYNLYRFFKIIKLPFILIFIPIVNIFTFILMPFNLAREYGCKEWVQYLSVLIPFIMIPYIAFSKLQNRNKKVVFDFLKYEKDVDELEDELKEVTNDNYIIDDTKAIPVVNKVKEIKSKGNEYVDSLEFSKSDDEYVEDEDHIEYKETHIDQIEEKPQEEVVDLEDDNNQIDIYDIDTLDEDIKESSKSDVKIEQDIKDYEKDKASVTAIAFGGKEKRENMTESKIKDLKCPYCKSSLAGSKGTCPGCGKDVSDLVFEKVKLTQIKM